MYVNSRPLLYYPMVGIAIALMVGIVVGKAAYVTIPVAVWLAFAGGSFIAAIGVAKFPIAQSILIFTTFLATGAFLTVRSLDRMNANLPRNEIGYEAVLLSEPVVHGKVVQTDLLVVGIDGKAVEDFGGKPVKVKASILRDTVDNRWRMLHVGDGIKASSFLEEPHNFAGSTFDYASWLKEHGFAGETFIYYTNWRKAEVSLGGVSPVYRTVIAARKMRQNLLSRYHDYGADGKTYAVLAAMTLGDKSALSRDLKDDYSISGASHVLALSGLHLGIIYKVFLAFFALGMWRRKWIPQLLTMLAIWSYVVLVGMSQSVLRSAIMLTILSVVRIVGNKSATVNSLAVAAVVMLLFNPLNLYDIGFEMSFMAVLGILLFEPVLPRYEVKWNKSGVVRFCERLLRWVCGLITVSIAAQIATAPLVIYYFHRFSCYFFISNLVVIPCAILILNLTVAAVALYWWTPVSAFVGKVVMWLVDFLNASLHWVASLPSASIENLSLSRVQLVGVYLSIFAVYLILIFFKRHPTPNTHHPSNVPLSRGKPFRAIPMRGRQLSNGGSSRGRTRHRKGN